VCMCEVQCCMCLFVHTSMECLCVYVRGSVLYVFVCTYVHGVFVCVCASVCYLCLSQVRLLPLIKRFQGRQQARVSIEKKGEHF